jgi:hypothetical protein
LFRNALKVTYEHLRFEIFFWGYASGTPLNRGGRTRGGKGREGRERKGRERKEGREESGAPSFQSSAPRFPWVGYGPAFIVVF